MFTGLIEEVGRVEAISDANGTRRITVAGPRTAAQLAEGESVSVSGVCLTALAIQNGKFSADLAAETLARTSLSRIQVGTTVNLELAMPASSEHRFGGHMVQGHVDGMVQLAGLSKIHGREDYWLTLTIPREMAKYVVEKGSITVEGISLTVASVEGTKVKIAIIPHTYEATNLRELKPGDPLNIEVDIMAKYVEKMLEEKHASSSITLERLQREGF
jgi:riboflavin synthase